MDELLTLPASTWHEIATLCTQSGKPWPLSAALADWHLWVQRRLAGDISSLPGRNTLSERWNWTRYKASQFLLEAPEKRAELASRAGGDPLETSRLATDEDDEPASRTHGVAGFDISPQELPLGKPSPRGLRAPGSFKGQQPVRTRAQGPWVQPPAQPAPHGCDCECHCQSHQSSRADDGEQGLSTPQGEGAEQVSRQPAARRSAALSGKGAQLAAASSAPGACASKGSGQDLGHLAASSQTGSSGQAPPHRQAIGHREKTIARQVSLFDSTAGQDRGFSAQASSAEKWVAPPAPPAAGTEPAISSLLSSSYSRERDLYSHSQEKKQEEELASPATEAHPTVIHELLRLLNRWSGKEAPPERRWLVSIQEDLRWFLLEVATMKEAMAVDLADVLRCWDEWLERTARSAQLGDRVLFPRFWKAALRKQIQLRAAWQAGRKDDRHEGFGSRKRGGQAQTVGDSGAFADAEDSNLGRDWEPSGSVSAPRDVIAEGEPGFGRGGRLAESGSHARAVEADGTNGRARGEREIVYPRTYTRKGFTVRCIMGTDEMPTDRPWWED